jgi:hypothetical protein
MWNELRRFLASPMGMVWVALTLFSIPLWMFMDYLMVGKHLDKPKPASESISRTQFDGQLSQAEADQRKARLTKMLDISLNELTSTGQSKSNGVVKVRGEQGRIVYEPLRHMEQNKAEQVIVRVDAGGSHDLYEGMPEDVVTKSFKLARLVRLQLTGDPNAFEIKDICPPDGVQEVTNLSAAVWIWNVLPKKSGNWVLTIHIWSVERINGADRLSTLARQIEKITVRTTPLPDIDKKEFVDKMLDKLAEHFGEAVAAGIIALLGTVCGVVWRRFRGRKLDDAKAPAG